MKVDIMLEEAATKTPFLLSTSHPGRQPGILSSEVIQILAHRAKTAFSTTLSRRRVFLPSRILTGLESRGFRRNTAAKPKPKKNRT